MKENHKVALAVIAKNKQDIIERMLTSTQGVFDIYCLQDTGSTDKTIKLFKDWCVKNNKEHYISKKKVGKDYKQVIVDGQPMLGDFSAARNDSFKLIPKGINWAFWIDTDDAIYNAKEIPQLVEYCETNKIDQVIMTYDYAKAVDGLKPVTQRRERLINLRKKGEWKNRVHENYQFSEQSVVVFDYQLPFKISIQHERTGYESLSTNRRNKLIMLAQLEEEGIEKYPDEQLHHLAFDCWEHKEYDEAINYYNVLLQHWNGKQLPTEQVYNVYMKLANAHIAQRNLDEAIKYASKGFGILPNFAEAYLIMAQVYSEMGQWDEVEHYSDKVLKIGKPQTTAPINDFDYTVNPLLYKLNVYLNKGDIKNATETVGKLRQLMPSNPVFLQQAHELKANNVRSEAIRAISVLKQYYQDNNKAGQLDRLRSSIPLELLEDDTVRSLIKEMKHDEYHKKAKIRFPETYTKSIVFYAGEGYELWDGDSDNGKGIGGSEGMCIQLARELASLGNKVFVYNSCGYQSKIIDGVTYMDSKQWDSNSKCDIFVSLRRPDVFGRLIKASKQYLWLHDTEYGEVPLTNFYSTNNVIILTDYHKDIIKLNHGVKDDRIFWTSRNALNKRALEYTDSKEVKRDKFKVIYGSSYDRGLINLLNVWPKIKEAVPEATLDIYYGTVTMDKMIEMYQQVNPQISQNMKNFKSELFEKISKCDGVRELGRISQTELYMKFKEAGIWAYPTEFQEISCITAMQAQALGAFPVCTPFAALNETVKYGTKVNLNNFAEALIYQLQHQDKDKRAEMMDWARKEYDVTTLAKEWNNKFNND